MIYINEWEPNATECKAISTGQLAQQWEENDKIKVHSVFAQYPHNTQITEALQKAEILDRVYSTQILRFNKKKGLQIVAQHICSLQEIDKRISDGNIFVIDEIADTKEELGKNIFSFATKYSYFCNPIAYPICDKNVCTLLHCLNQKHRFFYNTIPTAASEFPKIGGSQVWKKIIDSFKDHFNLQGFTYREIDLYLSIWYKNNEKMSMI